MKRLASFVSFTLVSGTTILSSAQSAGFAVNRYEPAERGSDWFANESLDLRGRARPALGIVGDYAYRPLVLYRPDGELDRSIVRNNLFAHVGGNIVLADRLRLAVSMPFQMFADGKSGRLGDGTVLLPPPNEQGVGDLRFGADLRLAGEYGGPATLAFGMQAWAPTGQRDQYAGDGEFRFRPRVMVAGDIGIFTYAVQGGVAYRARSGTLGGAALGSDLSFAAAAGLRLADGKLTVGPEVFGSTVLDDAFAKQTTPFEALLGAHLAIGDIRLGAGVGPGVSRGLGAPEVRALLSIDWTPALDKDSDGDGILDKEDACPTTVGERSSDPALNGCPRATPPPADADGDGVPDSEDACRDVAGPRTSDPRTNGCPPDADGDGILDPVDACPADKGIRSEDATRNGCPDKDGDGVFDRDDACVDVAGLKTSDPKTNGCPDPDRDKDGILNAVDACPDEPGKADPDPKANGCPKAFVSGGQIRILSQVKFKTGSAQILPGNDSEEVLTAVLQVLTSHPDIKKVRVEGHTDNRGAAALNKKLSADRASSVVKWLVDHGIAKERLSSAGFGSERPISTSTTEEGLQNNRRVEFHVDEEAEKQ